MTDIPAQAFNVMTNNPYFNGVDQALANTVYRKSWGHTGDRVATGAVNFFSRGRGSELELPAQRKCYANIGFGVGVLFVLALLKRGLNPKAASLVALGVIVGNIAPGGAGLIAREVMQRNS